MTSRRHDTQRLINLVYSERDRPSASHVLPHSHALPTIDNAPLAHIESGSAVRVVHEINQLRLSRGTCQAGTRMEYHIQTSTSRVAQ